MHPVFRANGYKIPPVCAVIVTRQTVGGNAVCVVEFIWHNPMV